MLCTPTCTLEKEKGRFCYRNGLFSSGDWTRTSDLWVMSPTSYQLLHPALFGNTKVRKKPKNASNYVEKDGDQRLAA